MEATIPNSTSNLEKPINVSENSAEHVSNDAEDATEKQSEKPLHTTRVYNRVPNQVRKELVDRVYKSGESIYEAAIQLGIKYSTAKTIVKIYRQEGRIDKMDPNECKKSNAKKKKGKVGSKWIKKTNTEARSEAPRKESGTVKHREVLKTSRNVPNTRLRSGIISKPTYFNGQDEAVLVRAEALAESAREEESMKKVLRNAKREHEENLAELKAQPRKLRPTHRNGEKKPSQEESKTAPTANESKASSNLESEKLETNDEAQTGQGEKVFGKESMKEESLKPKTEPIDEIAAKIHSIASNAGTPLGFLPNEGLFMPRLDLGREMPFQLPLGIPPRDGLYNPIEQLLIAKNLQMQNLIGLNAGQANLGNQMLLNFLRMGGIPGLNMPLNPLQLMSFPSHSKKFF